MKTTSMKNERRMAGWLVLWCMGLLAMAVSSCDSELDVQQQYPFTVETMPVPKQLANGETAEIRCEVKSEGILTEQSIPSGIFSTMERVP